jgi:hypothetical protein
MACLFSGEVPGSAEACVYLPGMLPVLAAPLRAGGRDLP